MEKIFQAKNVNYSEILYVKLKEFNQLVFREELFTSIKGRGYFRN